MPTIKIPTPTTVQQLTLYNSSLELSSPSSMLMKLLRDMPELPGCIVTDYGRYVGMISRRQFMEMMSRPFGLELFLKRPIAVLYSFISHDHLYLSGETSVIIAAQTCVQRPLAQFTEPLIIIIEGFHYLLDVQTLLLAYAKQYETASHVIEEQLQQSRRTEKELLTAKQEAAEAHKVKAEFLTNMSHELRTPLNAILGMVESLLSTSINETQQDYCQIIRESGESLLNSINDLLNFSQLETGELELERKSFDLRLCIEESLQAVAHSATQKNLTVAYHVDKTVPDIVIGDAVRLKQILNSLLNNAIKFTQQGEIILSVNSFNATGRRGRGRYELEELHFALRDTGMGIAAHQLNRLFQAFSQIDSSLSRRYGGLGLGLMISKHLCELMGGSMWVESEEQRGSIFHFTIKVKVAHELPYQYLYKIHPNLQNKRILLVNLHTAHHEIALYYLELWGMKIQNIADIHELPYIEEENRWQAAMVEIYHENAAIPLIRTLHQIQANLPIILLTKQYYASLNSQLDNVYLLSQPLRPARLYELLTQIMLKTETDIDALAIQSDDARQFCELEPAPPAELTAELAKTEQSLPVLPQLNPFLQGFKCVKRLTQINTEEMTALPQTQVSTNTIIIESILLIETNVLTQFATKRILEKLGYHVDIATEIQKAYQLLIQHHYQLLLLDLQLFNPFTLDKQHPFLQWLLGNHQKLTIVGFASGCDHCQLQHQHWCEQLTLYDCLQSPLTRPKLLTLLERLKNPPALV